MKSGERLNILFGGKAGQGPNVLTRILAKTLSELGYYVFYSRDYQSIIRSGHNFNVITISDKPVSSNDSQMDLIVALDENTIKIHKSKLKKSCTTISGEGTNMYFAGRVFKVLGLDFKLLDKRLKNLSRYEENIKQAKQGYEDAKAEIKLPSNPKIKPTNFQDGSQAVAQGAMKSGLEFYYAYPMTPATTVLTNLAQASIKGKHKTIELENEIAIVNAGIGSAITGALTMVGTSGGGFDLMTEGLSLTGMAQVPLVFFLSQRPGPATGVATYTAQGDLNIALHAGHGEFNRIVVAPGTPEEAEELTNQAFYLSQKFSSPSIIISDKHLGESFYTITNKPQITKVPKLTKFGRYNSYETDSIGSATEDANIINKNIEARQKTGKALEKEAKKFEQYKIYGKKNSKNMIISWGSTKGAILDALNLHHSPQSKIKDDLNKSSKGAILNAIEGMDVCYLQILYMKPFPEITKLIKDKNLILVENNSTGQLGDVIKQETGIEIKDKNKILRYDGRPFLCDELRNEISKRI